MVWFFRSQGGCAAKDTRRFCGSGGFIRFHSHAPPYRKESLLGRKRAMPTIVAATHANGDRSSVVRPVGMGVTGKWMFGSSWPTSLSASMSSSLSSCSTTNEHEADNSEKGTIVPFRLADIGEGIAEVELLEWFVQPGDRVAQFDLVCRVQSDKATVEITSRYDGSVYDLAGHDVGDVIRVGSPLLHVAVDSPDDDDYRKQASSMGSGPNPLDKDSTLQQENNSNNTISWEAAVDDDSTTTTTNNNNNNLVGKKVLATPAVRRLGREAGIDLSSLLGSGPNGRILKSDVLQATEQLLPPRRLADQEVNQLEEKVEEEQWRRSTIEEEEATNNSVEMPLRGYHRIMVKSMTESLQVPHMCLTDDVDVTTLCAYRDEYLRKHTPNDKISYLPFAIKATSLALTQYPSLNATYPTGADAITIHPRHHIGIAMDTPRGLAVPAIRNCQEKSILQIAQDLSRLQTAAKDGTLCQADLVNPTFTLSNIGAIGGLYTSPIVAVPQVAIGAMGRIQRLPRFVSDTSTEITAVQSMPMSWAADHRVVDGATLARFSNTYKYYMEQPLAMLLTLQ